VDVLRLQFQERLIDHITKENEAYETETFESKVQMDQLIIGKRWDMPNQLKNKVGEVIRDITKRGQETGKHKDTIDVDIIKAVSPSIYTAIANAVNADQTDHARELLHGDGKKEEGYAALMTSKDISDAEKLIDGAEGEYKAQAASDEIYEMFKDEGLTAALAHLRSQPEYDEHRQDTKRFLTNRFAEADTARDLGFERAGIAARDVYASARDTDVPAGKEGSGSRATRKMK
jgi:hypothetical protein